MENLKKYLPALRKIFQRNKVVLAYLFGSQVNGLVGKLSDIDIAVLFEPKIFSDDSLNVLLDLMGELKKSLGRENIDVIPLNNASPAIRYQAVIRGQRIYSLNLGQACEFEKTVLQEYEDTTFLRQIYYHYMAERIRKNKFAEFPR